MTSEEYLRQLGDRLYSLPGDKRSEVLEYYRNYFERAGAENVDMVFRELGTPERLSQKIYEDYNRETMAYRDIMADSEKGHGHENAAMHEPYMAEYGESRQPQPVTRGPVKYEEDDYSADEVVYSEQSGAYKKNHKKTFKPWMLILLIFFAPMLLQLVFTLLLMLFAIPMAMLGGTGFPAVAFALLEGMVWILIIAVIIIKIIKRNKR